MRISDLIDKLQSVLDNRGDLLVMIGMDVDGVYTQEAIGDCVEDDDFEDDFVIETESATFLRKELEGDQQ